MRIRGGKACVFTFLASFFTYLYYILFETVPYGCLLRCLKDNESDLMNIKVAYYSFDGL